MLRNKIERTKGHDQVKFIRVLERKLQGHNERVINKSQNCAFCKDMRDFSWTLSDMGFTDRFEGVYSLGIFLANLHYFPEATLSNDLEEVKRFYGESFVADGLEVDLKVERSRASCRAVPLIGGML